MKPIVSKWNGHYTYDWTKFPGKLPGDDGMTVPEQALSISEIQARFVRGLPLPVDQRMGYTEVDASPFDGLDKLQKIDAARALARTKESLQKEVDEHNAKVAKQAQKEAFLASVDQRVNELKSQSNDSKDS